MNFKNLGMLLLSLMVALPAIAGKNSKRECPDVGCGTIPTSIKFGFIGGQGAAPSTFLTQEGEAIGFDIQLACELFRRIGVNVEFVPYCGPFNDAFVALRDDVIAGVVDVAGFSFTVVTPARIAVTPMLPIFQSPAGLSMGATFNTEVVAELPSGDTTALLDALREAAAAGAIIVADEGTVWDQILTEANIPHQLSSEFPEVDTVNPNSVADAEATGVFDVFVTDNCFNDGVVGSDCSRGLLAAATAPVPSNIDTGASLLGWRFAPETSCSLLLALQQALNEVIVSGRFQALLSNIFNNADFWNEAGGNLSTIPCFAASAGVPPLNAAILNATFPINCILNCSVDLNCIKPLCPGTCNTQLDTTCPAPVPFECTPVTGAAKKAKQAVKQQVKKVVKKKALNRAL